METPDAPCAHCKTPVSPNEPFAMFCDPRNDSAALYHAECYKKTVVKNLEDVIRELKHK